MQSLRTPDEQFLDLPGYDFTPNYLDISDQDGGTLRVHYLDVKAGSRIFPTLVPTSPDDPAVPANLAAWDVFKAWDKPFVTCFADGDAINA